MRTIRRLRQPILVAFLFVAAVTSAFAAPTPAPATANPALGGFVYRPMKFDAQTQDMADAASGRLRAAGAELRREGWTRSRLNVSELHGGRQDPAAVWASHGVRLER